MIYIKYILSIDYLRHRSSKTLGICCNNKALSSAFRSVLISSLQLGYSSDIVFINISPNATVSSFAVIFGIIKQESNIITDYWKLKFLCKSQYVQSLYYKLTAKILEKKSGYERGQEYLPTSTKSLIILFLTKLGHFTPLEGTECWIRNA